MNFLREVKGALGLLGRERRMRWVLLVVLALAVTGFEAVGAILVYTLMGLIAGGNSEVALPVLGRITDLFPDVPPQKLQLSVAGLVAVFFVVRSVVIIGQLYVHARLVYNAGARLSNHLLRGYLSMPYLAHTQINSAELIRNAFDSVQSLVTQVLKPAVEVVAELVLVIGLVVILLIIAPQATLLALAVLGPTIWLLMAVVQPRIKRLGRESQEARRGSLQALQQALGGLRDIRLLGREDDFAAVFAHQRRAMSRTQYLQKALAGLPRAMIETSLVLVIVAVFILTITTGDGPGTALSTLGLFGYAALRLQPSLRRIIQGMNNIRFGAAIIEDLHEDRRRVDSVLEALRNREAPDEGRELQRSIELRDVTFAYGPDTHPALQDVNLTIWKGEFIGICGPTGGGKSTLVDLIAGLLQPTHGQVLVDGNPLEEHPAWWYAELGVVSQTVYLMDDTMRRNIAFGQSDEEIDAEQLQRSIERAQLEDVVADLPDGIDTILGERGVRLSGGQRQRVAVARALYREPSVIIFDEGTSALDASTEALLVAAVDELKVGRTLISVAHRITTVREADRIVIVEGGRIAAEGSHSELLNRSELFRALAQ